MEEEIKIILIDKYEDKRKLCLEWINEILIKYKNGNYADNSKFENDIEKIAKQILNNSKYRNNKEEFNNLIPIFINIAKETLIDKAFDEITVLSNNNGDLSFEPSLTLYLDCKNNAETFKNRIQIDILSGLIPNNHIDTIEFKKLFEFINSNLEVALLLDSIVCDYRNCFVKQYQKTKEIFENTKKVYREKIIETVFYKNLSEEKQIIFNNELKIAESKIVTPKGYEVFELSDFYIKLAKRIKGKPSLRDLEKGSDYKRGKWEKNIFKDVEFIISLLAKLQNNKDKLSENLNKILIEYWTEKYKKIQEKEIKLQNKSRAKEYNDNIFNEENE